MPRRQRPTEQNFGSDSFLDVIANIVGILIILIVIAGVRVSQAPPPTVSLPGPVAETPTVVAAEEPEEELGAFPEVTADFTPPEEWEAERRKLTAEIAELDRAVAATAAEEAELQARHAAEQAALTEEEQKAARAASQTTQSGNRLGKLQARVGEQRRALVQLRTQLDELQKVSPNVKRIGHKVTPISRTVQGEELHFQLRHGRIAQIKLDELIQRLMKQAERQKEWLAKYRSHQGTVGPVNGFSLNYVIERQSMGPITGQAGIFRVAVSYFKVIPEPDLKGETAEEASRVGSEFHLALQQAAKESTLTFWVYPDSFELYRRLQSVAHDSGFTVAARPLPEGAPIAGSPNGSRSAGQ